MRGVEQGVKVSNQWIGLRTLNKAKQGPSMI
jgi:hypothetical protein